MRAWLVVVGVVGCGGKPPRPRPVVAQEPPTKLAPAAEQLAGCDEAGEEPLRIAGVTGEAVLATCTGDDHGPNPEAEANGFVEHDRSAHLVWKPNGKPAVATEIKSWSDGWEWGTTLTLAGSLVAPTGDGVVLVLEKSYAAGPGIGAYATRLVGYTFTGGHWVELASTGANTLEIDIAKDRRSAIVSGCEEASPPPAETPPGCGGHPDGEPAPVQDVRYDGSDLTFTPHEP